MNTKSKAALAVGACVLLALSLSLAGCTRPKPAESATPLPTATVALTPAATQALGTPAGTSAPQLAQVAVGTLAPTPTSQLPAPPEATPVPTAVPQEPTATPEPGASTYTVQAGDTLYGLAEQFGTTAAELAALNGISVDALLAVGQTLQVPGVATTQPGFHIVQAGENLYRIALRYGTTWQELAQLNNIYDPTTLRVGQQLVLPSGTTGTQPPPSTARTHVIRAGDTLYGLALQYGVTAQAIADANGLTLYSILYVGQTLTIP
jgi:LysM repeat protein